MLPKEKEMEVLEAFDLTKSYRAAGQLVGVDHKTVARAVAARALGAEMTEEPALRSKVAEAFADKITEWIERVEDGRGPRRCGPRQVGGHGL